ncbi:gibberellin-regulated protein 9 [Carica papaya]|uniref:gibberellin-regulated protein 9 n=1 Tax=Carica papaya TaxID=3649 RepID=UPI000B8CBA95|nr:gibberellin-regulated protein 9 [Carica papaya]
MKLTLVFLLFILLSQVLADASFFDINSIDEHRVIVHHKGKYHFGKINCSHECVRRCKEASRKKVCHRACKSCCSRCHCVPPGTYGNKKACPCYASLRTHGHKPKCP